MPVGGDPLVCHLCGYTAAASFEVRCPNDGMLLVRSSEHAKAPDDRYLGTTLGRYAVIGVEPRQGNCAVYRVTEPGAPGEAALRLVEGSGATRAVKDRFLDRGVYWRRVAHPAGFVPRDLGVTNDGGLFVITELSGGRPLSGASLTVEAILRAGLVVLELLDRIHARGLVHGMVRPGALWLLDAAEASRLGVPVRLLDMGFDALATLDLLRGSGSLDRDPGLGWHMSPEQAAGEEPGPLSDVYGLASTLYEALTGAPPFGTGEPDAVIETKRNREPLGFPEIPSLPSAIGNEIMRALSREPGLRHPTALAFAEALRAIPLPDEARSYGPGGASAGAGVTRDDTTPPLEIAWTVPPEPRKTTGGLVGLSDEIEVYQPRSATDPPRRAMSRLQEDGSVSWMRISLLVAFPMGLLLLLLAAAVLWGIGDEPPRSILPDGGEASTGVAISHEDRQTAARLVDEADLLASNQRTDDAIATLEEALRLDPTMDAARFSLGRLLVRAGRYPEAEEQLRMVEEGSEPGFMVDYYLGKALEGQGKLEDAIEAYRSVASFLAKYPNRVADVPGFFLDYGELLSVRGSMKEAATYLSRAIEDDPSRPKAWMLMAKALEGLGAYDQAVQFYSKALELGAAEAEVQYRIGMALLLAGEEDHRKVISHLEKAVVADQGHRFSDAYKRLGYLYRNLDEPRKALDRLEAYLELIPPDAKDRREVQREIKALRRTVSGR